MCAGSTDAADRSINELIESLKRGELSAADVMAATLRRLDLTEPSVHAYAHVARDEAMAAARERDELSGRGGWAGPLHGIPIGVKDLFQTCDMPTEAGSKVLAGNRPTRDAEAVRRLRAAGAIVVGKTVTHEFSYGLNVPPTRNAWDHSRYPGGSSAGSGVAVAAGSAAGSVGTDSAGSVRTPAAVNGIVGLKPTYGSVSTEGVIPSCPSLDHVGPLARRVRDCALLFRVLSGSGPSDPDQPPPALEQPLLGTRLGVERRHFFDSGVEPAVAHAVEEALEVLRQLGASVVETAIPELELAAAVSSTIMVVEASRWHRALIRERRLDYHPATRLMLELGQLLPAVGYLEAQQARVIVRGAVRRAFQVDSLDAIVAPSAPVTAPPIERATELTGLVHHQCPANVTGQPSISVPCGFSEDGLPIGLQLIGRPFAERTILRIAAAYEDVTTWHGRRPPVAA